MTNEERNKLFGFNADCPNNVPEDEMRVKVRKAAIIPDSHLFECHECGRKHVHLRAWAHCCVDKLPPDPGDFADNLDRK